MPQSSWHGPLRPYQATTPGLLASSVRARHFGLDGKPLGSERVLDEVVWWQGPADAERFEDLVVAQWRDGRYLVGWTAVDAWNRISCVVLAVSCGQEITVHPCSRATTSNSSGRCALFVSTIARTPYSSARR